MTQSFSAPPAKLSSPSSIDSCAGANLFKLKWPWALCFFFVAALAIRIIFLFIAPNNSTDAWSRYIAATAWLQHPSRLPPATVSDAWLPMHFWLLGAILWVTKSEMAARSFSVLLGSLTVVLLASIADRSFNRRVAIGSALLLAFFGFHIAFSVTTSSEALTVFLVVLGLYGWIRYASSGTLPWLLISAGAFDVASLCRFEPWLCAPVLALLLLLDDFGSWWPAGEPTRKAWGQAIIFCLLSSAGSVGWLIFSYVKWGDPLRLPHRTIWLNAHFQPSHHSVLFRMLTVPGSILISLSPLVVALALFGVVHILRRGTHAARATMCLGFVLFAFNYYNSVEYETTQARYTLLYSWLFLPFAFEGLCDLASRWRWAGTMQAFTAVLVFFGLWQVGIIAAGSHAPPPIGDHLGALSPTIPLHAELRGIMGWLKANGSQHCALILDDYNWESGEIFRFANLSASDTFSISQQDYDDPTELNARLERFVTRRHPGLLIYSPEGPIGRQWRPDEKNVVRVGSSILLLGRLWQGAHWQIYSISYQ